MATVDSWFDEFVLEHVGRFHRPDWPEAGSEFWESFRRLFVVNGVDQASARAASEALFRTPPDFPGDHPGAILAKVRELWRSASGPHASGPDAAKAESRGCPHCSGQGLATVYRPAVRPGAACSTCGEELPPDHLACPACRPNARRVPRTTAAHCVCPFGRWLRASLAKDADTLARVPDLTPVLTGHSVWLAAPPLAPEVPPGFDAMTALKGLLDLHRADRDPSRPHRARRQPPLAPDEAAFAAKLDPVRSARFASLDPTNRRLVMAAKHDPRLRAEAVGLIGPAPQE